MRPTEAKACVPVLLGIRADGRKELIALDSGYRKSGESRANLPRDAARRGMRGPVPAIGGGALGFWAALREVFPDRLEQCRRVRKTANVPGPLPQSAQPAAMAAPAGIRGAEDRDHAANALAVFATQQGAKLPNAVAKPVEDEQALPSFYAHPAEHRIHSPAANSTEPTFSTVRLRTEATRGADSRSAAPTTTFKPIDSAEARWRAVNAPHMLAPVRAGACFERGVPAEREAAA